MQHLLSYFNLLLIINFNLLLIIIYYYNLCITLGCSLIGTSTLTTTLAGLSLYTSTYLLSLWGILPVACTFDTSKKIKKINQQFLTDKHPQLDTGFMRSVAKHHNFSQCH